MNANHSIAERALAGDKRPDPLLQFTITEREAK
jgi:hypothetical protein